MSVWQVSSQLSLILLFVILGGITALLIHLWRNVNGDRMGKCVKELQRRIDSQWRHIWNHWKDSKNVRSRDDEMLEAQEKREENKRREENEMREAQEKREENERREENEMSEAQEKRENEMREAQEKRGENERREAQEKRGENERREENEMREAQEKREENEMLEAQEKREENERREENKMLEENERREENEMREAQEKREENERREENKMLEGMKKSDVMEVEKKTLLDLENIIAHDLNLDPIFDNANVHTINERNIVDYSDSEVTHFPTERTDTTESRNKRSVTEMEKVRRKKQRVRQ